MNFSIIPASWSPYLLSLLRIVTGLTFLEHGTGKLLKFPAGAVPPTFAFSSWPGYAGFFEFGCGLLLVLGLFSRVAAFVASGMCAVAYFMIHFPRGFFPILNGGELAVVYCFLFLYLAAAGPGPWSLDAKLKK
jgi:putative oxidoreductase